MPEQTILCAITNGGTTTLAANEQPNLLLATACSQSKQGTCLPQRLKYRNLYDEAAHLHTHSFKIVVYWQQRMPCPTHFIVALSLFPPPHKPTS